MRFHWTLLLAAAALLPTAASAQVPVTRRGLAEHVSAPVLGISRTLPILTSGESGARRFGLPDLMPDARCDSDARYVSADRHYVSSDRWRRRARGPRGYPAPRESRPSIVTQLGAGFYNPSGRASTSFLLSGRIGPQIDPHARLGLMLDWAHKSDRVSVTFGHETVGGVDLSLEDSRLRGRSDLVPLLAFLEIGGDESLGPIPYVGLGAGYEILSMEADRPDGSRFEGTFGGWGWQMWAGAGVPLGREARLNGELFFNRADLGRDVNFDGHVLRQTAGFNGVGMRFGVAWGF